MDNDNPCQPKNNSKMAELLMECEEEELEPWQRKAEEIQDEDDDLIFVGEISSPKPAISNILNRGNRSSSSKAVKNETLSQGATDAFKPTSEDYKDPTSGPAGPVPSMSGFHPESKPSHSSDIVQNVSKPDFTKNLSQDDSDDSSASLFDLTQNTMPLSQDGSIIYIEGETRPKIKRSSISKVSDVNPKKPKTSESDSKIDPCASLSLINSPSVTSPYVMLSKGTNISSASHITGLPYLRSCPKCNVQFNLLDPLKYHMKHCCPDMAHTVLEMIKVEFSSIENKTGTETGKLIMLVSDFYYGRHEGAVDDEEKTYTTFKCFSCLKVLKNNIRFMNHMKHHLELEKQNNESWESHTTCQHCYRQYPTPFQLQCHIESTHTPHEFSTVCKICELSFETEHILLQHMKDTHKPGEMPYICQVCQFRSSTFSDVETHFRASHENTKNLLCPFCLKVSRMATPYMNHYMKHQKKGVHRCTKCRLQFLTCKEKMDHKIQHRTFIKPKELQGLPPGTKITIRASPGPVHLRPLATSSRCTPSTSSLQVSPPDSKSTTYKMPVKDNASKSKTRMLYATTSTACKPSTSYNQGRSAPKYRARTSYKQRRRRNRKSRISIALKNLRCPRGVHKCIECHSRIKDFASHFSIFIHCNFCRYKTNCSRAFVNHMLSSHSNQPAKRFCIFKKHSGTLRGITLVCLKCDFLTDSSGLDRMAKHLSQRKTHTCQVVIENVPESTSASEPTSAGLLT
ncbi:zinc finger protein 280C [Hippopotamus amphibius kiboko]|uniref:zinc finger protein 280C n=1 Tax=Hippopotamus amphibius kiboko TaxID=575201 RepID=UPI00259197B3|nr:zinc finger protein 280C [Hippopotamus amphibius kiboko]XP_057575202.1 zinc finger protein 280C [Hippopotamus amphibius kiboko]